MASARALTLSRSFTESRSWSIGETTPRMKATRSSMWFAVIRMVTRQATDTNAQATTPTSTCPASPLSSLSLLRKWPISAAPSGAGLGADALERAVHVLKPAQDVAGVALGRLQDAVGGVDPVEDVPAPELVRRVLQV